jgi:hypothetical protein
MSVDYKYYNEIFGGEMSETVISSYLGRAEDTLKACVCCDDTAQLQTDDFKRAVCIQAEAMLSENGGIRSARLGDFSLTASDNAGTGTVCSAAEAVLINSGLYFRGGVCL